MKSTHQKDVTADRNTYLEKLKTDQLDKKLLWVCAIHCKTNHTNASLRPIFAPYTALEPPKGQNTVIPRGK